MSGVAVYEAVFFSMFLLRKNLTTNRYAILLAPFMSLVWLGLCEIYYCMGRTEEKWK